MDARSLNSGYYFRLLLPLLFLQKASGCQKYACSAVGIDDSSIIPDSSFTANSELNGYEAKKARFSSDRCWEPNGNGGVDDYLQIDLGKVFFICAVATKGNAKPNTPEWTTEYKISTSSDGTVWITYPEDNNSPKLFPGNTDWNIAVKNDLDIPVMAKLIRFTPTQYRKFKALRVEVFGIGAEVYQDPCSAVGVDYGNIIPNSSFTANSELRDDYAASKARFSSDYCWEPNGNGGVDHYLQIDLGKAFVICAVATKGNAKSSASEWTTEYKISTSSDGNLWIIYSDNNNSPKLFPGNTDTNTAVKNDLVTPVLAKLIRFTPTQYHNYKALRVEVYGIDSKDFSCKSLPVGVASVAKIPDNSMTSSSRYNISTPPSNGRLGYTAGSSWCAATSDQYLQVKMSSPYIICGVATQGDHKSDQWVQTYQIQTSTDGSSFTDYMHNNVIEDFAGNTDSNTIVKNMLYEGTVSQYIRINAKSDYGTTSCMRTELYGVQQNTVCSKMSIGVPYSSLIPDHRFSASSYIHNAYLPSYARLKNTKAWEPKTKNVGDWLHIDLGSVVYVCAVATQGNAYSSNEYAKKYKLKISLDNVNWRYYQENNADKTFTGNTDKTTIVTNTLAVPTKTKFLRFYPTVFNGYAAMRVDVYGVPATCSSPFGVEKGGSVKGDSKMTSSSESDSSHAASFGRLYGDASWCSNTSSNTEYIQIDLGKMVTLTGIATQGNHTMNKWVKNYTLKYSIDGSVWNDYRGNQSSAKVFQGNSDRTSIVVRWFSHPVTVRYVRVYPQSWNTAICMRIELFGCQCPSPPEIKELSNKILTAESSKNVDLECNVQEPLIKNIDWYSGGKDVTSHSGGITRTANFVKSVLRVNFTSANDVVNTYQCTNVACRKNFVCRAKYAKADSNADSIKGAEVLVNLEFPSAPSLSPVGSIHSRSVVVRWTQPSLKVSQASIQTYVIKYWNSGTTKTISVSHTATSHTLSSLSVCTSYNVTIKAVSKLGEGPWSNTKTFKTDSEVPTAAPGSVEAQAKTSQSILVKWQVPSNVRCAPSGYKVIYSKTSGRSHEATVNGGQSISYTLTGLDKWTEYSINVKVRNDKGYGSSSSPVVKLKTLEDEPDAAPESFKGKATSCTSISLSWDLPTSNKRNGNIKGYRLWYCKTGHCSSPLAVKTYTGTSTVLRNLDMYTQYTLKVLAYTSVGDGPYTNNITIRTHEGPPSPPTKVKTTVIDPVDSTGPKVKIEWEKPSFSYGEIKGYKVSYGKKEDENTKLFDNQTLSFEFDVCGGLSYITKVWAFHSKEGAKTVETVPINDYVPVQPTKPKVVEYNTTTFHVSFQPLPSTNGHIIIYELEINSTLINKMVNVSCGEVPCRGLANQTCSYTLHDLGQCTKYNIKVRAYTTKGAGPYSETVELKTSTPGSPRNLKVVMDQNTAKLEWLPPQPLAKPVQQYTISYYGRKTYDFSWDGFPSPNHTTRSTSLTTTVTDLYPATSYRFTVKAMTECGEGDYSNKVQGDTEVGEPPAPKRGNVSTITSAVGNITLWKISDINGKLDLFLVYIHEVKDKKRKKRSSDSFKLTCKEIAKDAAELRPHTETFPLGDGKKYGNYENVKLKEGKQFEVFQCGKTKNLYGPMGKIAVVKVPVSKDNTLSQTSTPNTTLVASLVTVFLLLIIGACAAVLFVIWRRRGRRENERSDNMKFQNIAEMEEPNGNATSRDVPTHNNDGFVSNGTPFPDDDDGADLYGNAETIRHQPIPANKFNQYVNEKNEALKGEFKLLSNGQLFPCDVAKDPKNKPKNRYANIITYNHSRVVLQDTADGSDYINASYIHGFDGTPRTYIATQGPNPLTVPDIWHMIWQENITTIVILTNLIEGGKVKCHQYWPDHKEQYGPFTVNLHRSDILADYVVRIFIISKDGEIGNRQVYHYQYTSWPDKGVPQHATSVLGFRRKVKSQYMSSGATAPLLVHCSAGVGRTGAFLAIDAMMEKVKKEKSVDIFNYVQLMRNNRSTMIQTDEQYLFVHLALQEAITCGNTEIPVLNLNIALTRLSKERPRDRQTGYELEWRRLAAISPKVTVENSKAGRLEQNIPRNRYTDTFPFDSGRVFLSQEQQNYINASFGDAYRERNAFIMAQAPMENTMTDFWHMIHQYKIGSIVMLNKLTEDQETFPQYWPVQGSDMYEGIIVEVVSSSTRGPLFITQCVVTHPWEPKSPHNVLHIQHTDWPESGVPSDSQSVLEIVDKVQKSQQQSGNAPIAVHCSDGVGRSGTFCAVYSLLERVKSEQVMDVFQAIKVLRLGRPNAVATLDQYKFCYRMVQIYLDSFNDYANFSEV